MAGHGAWSHATDSAVHVKRIVRRIGIALGILAVVWLCLGIACILIVRAGHPLLGFPASLVAGATRFYPAERTLMSALDSENEEMIAGAALGLGFMKSRRGGPKLVDLLGTTDLDTRGDVTTALVMIDDPSTVPRLVKLASARGRLLSGPRFARCALAQITRSPNLQVFARLSGKWDDTDEGGTLFSEDDQIAMIEKWWVSHRHEYEGTGH